MLVASAVPSSRFLERDIIGAAGIGAARTVVELGPGTGGTTRAMLGALPDSGRLLSIELNPDFAALLREETDRRFALFNGSAERLADALAEAGLGAPDVVVSGIPFSTMPREIGRRIAEAVWSELAPGGAFVAYQMRDAVARIATPIMGEPEQAKMSWLNLPPMRVYRWRKPAA